MKSSLVSAEIQVANDTGRAAVGTGKDRCVGVNEPAIGVTGGAGDEGLDDVAGGRLLVDGTLLGSVEPADVETGEVDDADRDGEPPLEEQADTSAPAQSTTARYRVLTTDVLNSHP